MLVGSADRMPSVANPVLVEVVRGDHVESVHRGSAVVVERSGRIVAAWGDHAALIFPRSAVKPLQALPLLESGAARRWGVNDAELALASASHNGEEAHVERVAAWLARLGLSPDALICGAHPPLSAEAAAAMIRTGRQPGRLHNNCSGKHAGFLTVARHLDSPVESYGAPDHPVQVRVATTLAHLAGIAPATLVAAVDGCGVPTWTLPLAGLARAFVNLANRSAAANGAGPRLLRAMTAFPHLVAGHGRIETSIMTATHGHVVLKGGAEGVAAAVLPVEGLGIAIKIDDGAKRAVECATATLLRHIGTFDGDADETIAAWAEQPILNTRGDVVGWIRPAAGWPA